MASMMEHVTVTAPDISCGHCVATVKDAVGTLPGVAASRRMRTPSALRSISIRAGSRWRRSSRPSKGGIPGRQVAFPTDHAVLAAEPRGRRLFLTPATKQRS